MSKTIISFFLLVVFFWQPTVLTARNPFPLEVLYAHIDKQNYFTGENIWFCVYLVCSQSHVQTTSSRYVYVELINSQREVVNRVMIRHENGVFAGHIPVTEALEAGVYNLRFFTRHLENFGEEYFFQRAIHIITSQSLQESDLSEQVKKNDLSEDVPTINQNDSFSISFHPEGGDIPIGIETAIAFNAINSNGLGEHITGTVVNERGDIITHFESTHLGMGSFEWTANSDEQFFAIVRNTAGIERTFQLPRAKEDAISLQIHRHEGNIIVHLPKTQTQNRVLYLSLQQRGASSSERWNNERNFLIIPENNLPTGVVGIVLSDAEGIPLSKRQIFNTNRVEIVNTTFTTKNETHETRERVNATVTVTNSENFPLNANFSISVIDNNIAHYDTSVNILSTLLLASELRGHIENPAYYFDSKNENAKEHLDLVMLTHGWTRFDVNRIDEEEATAVWQDFERSQTITGTLQGTLLRRRGNQLIRLMVPEFGFVVQPFDAVYTDGEGRFQFENFEFPEGTWFRLQSERHTEIQVDEVRFPAVTNFLVPTKLTLDDEDIELLRQFMHEDDWLLDLDEFVVVARRQGQSLTRRVNREMIDGMRGVGVSLKQLLEDFLNLRGLNLVVLDGLDWSGATDVAAFEEIFINMSHVISIEIQEHFGLPMSIIGKRYDAVVKITTDVRLTDRNLGVISPLGYQITQEFFAPTYTTPEQRANERTDLRATIFWNPNVTTGKDGSVEIYFYTSDNVGDYVVIIEGITDEGKIVHSISRLR